MRLSRLDLLTAALLALPTVSGCDDGGAADPPHVPLSDEVTWQRVAERLPSSEPRNPGVPEERAAMLAEGLGDEVVASGEPHLARGLAGVMPEDPGPGSLIARFVHLADMQLTDDESPARVARLDSPGITSGALRPQESHGCQMVDAMVRTIGRLHAERPLDLVLLGGDNIDNAQDNELSWVLTLLGAGGTLACDSGADDDPIAGPGNDPKDPFEAAGLGAVPWRWVTGNHDILVQGNVAVDDHRERAVGAVADFGTRDWSLPGGPVVTGDVVADPARALLDGAEVIARVAADGDGHGLRGVGGHKATYAFDVAGGPLRIVVIDTAAATGGASGLITQAEVDATLGPLLDDALAEGRWVILAAHHAAGSLTDGGGLGGTAQEDALTTEDFTALVTSYPNIVLSLVGHSHQHRIRELAGPARALFEVTTAAIADYPHQSRLVEVFDHGEWLRVRLTVMDFDVTDLPLAAQGRRLGVLDWVIGWSDRNESAADERNVDLWIPAP